MVLQKLVIKELHTDVTEEGPSMEITQAKPIADRIRQNMEKIYKNNYSIIQGVQGE